ncbi:hypothetical protein B7R54_07205 [Subtercola boreus]|uniref:Uncharacterized protein n=1 Tax=Subtercola boreus TaxID=120213 RepID=A0A3E0VHB9_9MICO|nr:hypothetical protein [Subtercola boreus]RFA09035.1 hypothetical protein B7R54_07205 [Subtercola boreus]
MLSRLSVLTATGVRFDWVSFFGIPLIPNTAVARFPGGVWQGRTIHLHPLDIIAMGTCRSPSVWLEVETNWLRSEANRKFYAAIDALADAGTPDRARIVDARLDDLFARRRLAARYHAYPRRIMVGGAR